MNLEVGLFDAKTRLSELVDRVFTNGDEVLLTRRGKPVARIVPLADEDSAAETALALLLLAREGSSAGPGSLRELIDDGRR